MNWIVRNTPSLLACLMLAKSFTTIYYPARLTVILWTKLKNKHEFDDPTQVYLRVTLSPKRGKSAGIPYVMEIWPS